MNHTSIHSLRPTMLTRALLLATSFASTALAEEPAATGVGEASAPSTSDLPVPPPDTAGSPAAAPAPPETPSPTPTPEVATPAPTASLPGAGPASPTPLRVALGHAACEAATTRFTESALGLAGAGTMIGVGFAAEGPDMTWSHVFWVTGGVVGAASLVQFFVPSELERVALDSPNRTDAEIRAAWKELAAQKRVERYVGGTLSTLIGSASIIGGALVLDGSVGDDLNRDNRTILGTSFVAGGALTIARGLVDFVVPSAEERGFALAEDLSGPTVSFSAAPTPGGFAAQLTGVF